MTQRTRVKICGITRLEDALTAEAAGADALGFVFVNKSKRWITPEAAASIAAQVPPFVVRVGLFLDPDEEEVRHALTCLPDLLPQFHGRESAEFCQQFARPYIKALGRGNASGSADDTAPNEHATALAHLYDSHEPGQLGGTGHAFDWSSLTSPEERSAAAVPLVLAGGLSADNVASAIAAVRPYAVDVSSGVEQEKGIKDAVRIRAFMAAVQRADAHLAGL